jgi:hypothetical protein
MNLRKICCFPEPQTLFVGSPQTNRWYATDQRVVITAYSPPIEGTNTSAGIVGISARWDQDPDAPLGHATPGSGDAFYDGPEVLGTDDTLSLAAAGLGCHTARVFGWDNTGRSDYRRYGPLCFDNVKPVVSCGSPDGAWHATDVQIECTASDTLSGLLNFADADFFLSTSAPAGTETADASTGSNEVLDVAGNFVIAGPIGGNKVDKKPPGISIFSPAAVTYTVRQAVPASYACSDGGSGTATCTGPVASGSNIDTATVGTKTFTVNSTDNVGNGASRSVTYNVTYRICLLYDPTKASSGRGFAIRLQLCDANSANVSEQSIAVTAVAVDGSPAKAKPLGSLNPGNVFLYGPGTAPGASYLYNLDTKGLAAGSHVLTFTVQGDPIVHAAPFKLG